MNWITVVNAVASGILAVATGAFLIFVFGRENSLIHKLGVKSLLSVKLALSVCSAGALYNVLTLSTPPLSELVMNVGLAMLFSWAAVFHYNRFIRQAHVKASKKSFVKKAMKKAK